MWQRSVEISPGPQGGIDGFRLSVWWDTLPEVVTSCNLGCQRFLEMAADSGLERQFRRLMNQHWQNIRERFD